MNKDPKTGKFLPGHKANASRIGPVVPHPLYPGRDTQGHMMDYQSSEVAEVRAYLFRMLTPERKEYMQTRLFELMACDDKKIAMQALSLAYLYYMGKPEQKVNVQKAEVTMTKDQGDEMLRQASLN